MFFSREIKLLIAAVAAVVGVWGFVEISDEVQEKETFDIEKQIVRWMRLPEDPSVLRGPKWLRKVGRDITALGGHAVLTLGVSEIGGFLFLLRRRLAALLVLTTAAGGWVLSAILKSAFHRGRPDLPPIVYVTTASFPSGHAMLSTAVYLILGMLAAEMVAERRLKIYCLLTATLITLLVGASRVYLGIHYPSDVLAGWLAGLAWAMICWLAYRILEKRG